MAFTLSILDVGHGNSAVISVPGWVAVVDAGPGNALLEFLKSQEVTVVDEVLISHADEDHIGGLIGLLASGEIAVRRVRLNTDARKGSDIWDDLLKALDAARKAGHVDFTPVLTAAESGHFDHEPVRLEILGPSTYLAGKGPGSTDRDGRLITTNSISAVIRLAVGDRALALFPGDIDQVGLDELLRDGVVDARAEVLVFPHHGGRAGAGDVGAFSDRIVRAVQPATVVFSIGRGRHGTPLPEVVTAVRAAGTGVRIACTQLSERCAAVLPIGEAAHLNSGYARGRERSHCCAGTIVVTDGLAARTVQPAHAEHVTFIKGSAPTALCS